ncbi:MAG: hypothetical protein ACJ79R_09565 [Anaeromyxobacteraceae bacterium]
MLFLSFFDFDFDDDPLMSSEEDDEEPDEPIDEEPLEEGSLAEELPLLLEPLIPVPVPLPERESDPVAPPLMLPDPVLPVPVVSLLDPVPELEGLDVLELDGLELELDPEGLELDELELDLSDPAAPADMMSIFWTLSASPEPEKLART